jgi:hypothetical protein
MQLFNKSELTCKNKLYKHSTMRGTTDNASRVLTLLDLISMIKEKAPTAVIDVDPVRTSKHFTLLSWIEGSGLQNTRSKTATWDDAITFIGKANGTINIDLSWANPDMLKTTEMVTYPSYLSGTIPAKQSSEFITHTEMAHILDNTTFA